MDAPSPKGQSNAKTLLFIVILSVTAALILSILASALAKPKEIAKELDRSKQMLIAAKILSHEGYFLIHEGGQYIPAREEKGGLLVADPAKRQASQEEILEVYTFRLIPVLTNDQGVLKTFQELNLNESTYLSEYRKSGYYKEPWKLLYKIRKNGEKEADALDGYVIPVNGYGLWDAMYGYIALAPDGDQVIGISWYDQKETPGLGANITEPDWQNQFYNKQIFQESPDGKTSIQTAPLGITVVKGKVIDVYGTSPKAKSAVDGMTGATLTGYGVTDAYRDVLAAYRPFLEKVYRERHK